MHSAAPGSVWSIPHSTLMTAWRGKCILFPQSRKLSLLELQVTQPASVGGSSFPGSSDCTSLSRFTISCHQPLRPPFWWALSWFSNNSPLQLWGLLLFIIVFHSFLDCFIFHSRGSLLGSSWEPACPRSKHIVLDASLSNLHQSQQQHLVNSILSSLPPWWFPCRWWSTCSPWASLHTNRSCL